MSVFRCQAVGKWSSSQEVKESGEAAPCPAQALCCGRRRAGEGEGRAVRGADGGQVGGAGVGVRVLLTGRT